MANAVPRLGGIDVSGRVGAARRYLGQPGKSLKASNVQIATVAKSGLWSQRQPYRSGIPRGVSRSAVRGKICVLFRLTSDWFGHPFDK